MGGVPMKQFEDSFLKLYNEYETELNRSDNNMKKRYNNVLNKANLTKTVRKSTKVLVVAALVATTSTVAAIAATYNASDSFKNVLQIHPSEQQSTDISEILDKAGIVINDTINNGNISMSLRAIVGDEHHINILIDVEDINGNPLAIKEEAGDLSKGELFLGDYTLMQGDQIVGGSARYDFINGSSPDKATVLLKYTTDAAPIRGKMYSVHIENLQQWATLKGTSLKMDTNNMYDLVSKFGNPKNEDFRKSGHSNGVYDYHLSKHTDKSYTLTSDYPDIQITNGTVRDGNLYLFGTAKSEQDLNTIMENAALVNTANNNSFLFSGGSIGDYDKAKGQLDWSIRFKGVTSVEQLKGYVWTYGDGEGVHNLAEGAWDFTFTLDYENTTIISKPNQAVVWEGNDMIINNVELSPFTLVLDYTVSPETVRKMHLQTEAGTIGQISKWNDSYKTIIINMKDGSTQKAEGPGEYSIDFESNEYKLNYVLDAVIDPTQVESIQIENQTIVIK